MVDGKQSPSGLHMAAQLYMSSKARFLFTKLSFPVRLETEEEENNCRYQFSVVNHFAIKGDCASATRKF